MGEGDPPTGSCVRRARRGLPRRWRLLRRSRVKELADLFVRFLETNTAPEGLFAEDVFLDLTLPQWRLQTSGRFEERWEDEQGAWYCRELMSGDIRDGALSEVSLPRS
ncbi:hypothetical protein ACFWIO_23230 [Streptomyces diastatochromogenes]|uniref:hypothetical protein n=1 Tax=Streptomyces diastatochromogenes TaxID=42236 RepID=UPI003652F22C